MGDLRLKVRKRVSALLATLLVLQALAPALQAGEPTRARVSIPALATPAKGASFHLASRASVAVEAAEAGRRIRFSGTGWGLWTPMLFGATRGIEALTMKGASTEERVEHATKWATEPRFWGAVGADLLVGKLGSSLLSAMGVGGFAANFALCFAGFGTFQGVYEGFDTIDWGKMAFQSLALTMVEVAVSTLGLPGGPLIPFLASLAVCMMLDSFDGYSADREDDPTYAPAGSSVSTGPPAAPAPAGLDTADAYRHLLQAAASPDRAALADAYGTYRAATGSAAAAAFH